MAPLDDDDFVAPLSLNNDAAFQLQTNSEFGVDIDATSSYDFTDEFWNYFNTNANAMPDFDFDFDISTFNTPESAVGQPQNISDREPIQYSLQELLTWPDDKPLPLF